MSFIQLICLAFIQGLTEFLPISSSGHLVLFSHFTYFGYQGISFDVALHLGSLFAVVLYFRNDLFLMTKEVFKNKLKPDFSCSYNKLAYMILLASLPALCIGFALRHLDMEVWHTPKIIGINILIYGLLLYAADTFMPKEKSIKDIGIKQALFIGFGQCLALIPGTSRSGITITIARLLKINRTDAAKFSMLLSIPVILAAFCLEMYRLYISKDFTQVWLCFSACVYSFLFSYGAIFLMMKWLQKWSYLPFVIYRICLGVALIFVSLM